MTWNVSNSFTIPVPSQAELGHLITQPFLNGQKAFVYAASCITEYTLVPAIGTADGRNIINTADDQTRQWVASSMLSRFQRMIISTEIDGTVASTGTIIIPAMPGYLFFAFSNRYVMTATGGTATGNVTSKLGNNATHDNFVASGASPTTAVHALGVNGWGNKPISFTQQLDLVNPIVMDITIPATGTGNFVFRFRMLTSGIFLPNPIQ